MYRETDIYIYMVKNVYRYNCACARVRFSIQNVYTFGTKGPQKCMHFRPKVYALLAEVYVVVVVVAVAVAVVAVVVVVVVAVVVVSSSCNVATGKSDEVGIEVDETKPK